MARMTITKTFGGHLMPLQKNNMLKLAFGYCRVSSEEQKGNYSIGQQKRAISEFAERNGYKIVKFFIDDGISATADNRPDFLQMINECEEGKQKIQAVLVYHTDRFCRNELDHALYKQSLKKVGVELVSMMQPMIDESPEGYLMDSMMAGINAYYSRDLSRKTKRGMLGRWNASWWPGWAPPGYVNINREGQLSKKFYSADKQKLYDALERRLDPIEVDLITGPLITEVFHLYSTGNYSYATLARMMSKKGLVAINGDPISPQSINAIIDNPFYYGLMKWGKPKQEKIGKHNPLTTKELFDLCHYVSAQHRQFLTRERKHTFLLRGIAYCSIHKGKKRVSGYKKVVYEEDYLRLTAEKHYGLNSQKRDEISYYHCNKTGGCKSTYIETEKLEKQVANYIKKFEFKPEFIELVKAKVKEILQQSKGDIQGQVQALENRKKGLKTKNSRLLELRIDGELTKEKFLEAQAEIEGKINEIESQIYELERKSKLDYKLIDEVLSLTTNTFQTYMEAPDFLKRHYLRLFFERIYVKDRKIWKIAENPIFSVLRKQQQVIINSKWLLDLDSNQDEWIQSPLSYR